MADTDFLVWASHTCFTIKDRAIESHPSACSQCVRRLTGIAARRQHLHYGEFFLLCDYSSLGLDAGVWLSLCCFFSLGFSNESDGSVTQVKCKPSDVKDGFFLVFTQICQHKLVLRLKVQQSAVNASPSCRNQLLIVTVSIDAKWTDTVQYTLHSVMTASIKIPTPVGRSAYEFSGGFTFAPGTSGNVHALLGPCQGRCIIFLTSLFCTEAGDTIF